MYKVMKFIMYFYQLAAVVLDNFDSYYKRIRVNWHFSPRYLNILAGFLPNRSVDTAFAGFMEQISLGIDSRTPSLAIFFDMTKRLTAWIVISYSENC